MRFPVLAALSLALFASSARSSTQDAEAFLKNSINEVVAIASKSKDSAELAERIRPVLVRTISFSNMTRSAIGPGWRDFSEAERDQATALFTALIIRKYSSRFTPGELPEIQYKSSKSIAPGKVEVSSTTLYQGSRYEVLYRLGDLPGKGWRVTDVNIEGVSMVRNYRDQFDSEFKSGGVAAVLNALDLAVKSRK